MNKKQFFRTLAFALTLATATNTMAQDAAATPDSEHCEPLNIVTQELGGKDMEQNHAKIDKWLTELGF